MYNDSEFSLLNSPVMSAKSYFEMLPENDRFIAKKTKTLIGVFFFSKMI